MKKTKYKQCRLVKKTETGTITTVSWIPEKFANVGGVVKLKNEDVWVDGWVVKFASEDAVDEPPDYRKSVRAHKKRTGDSLPKENQ